MSPLASRFLQALASRPGEIVSRNALIEQLWDGNALVGEPALNRVVSELRKAAGEEAKAPKLVQTIPRKGYRLLLGQPAPAPPVSRRFPRWLTAAAGIAAAVVALAAANWLLETAIGLIWTLRH
ncbi:MAG: winged helix-turn-helix domain-containing protein [Hyphomonadaceae bacterium]